MEKQSSPFTVVVLFVALPFGYSRPQQRLQLAVQLPPAATMVVSRWIFAKVHAVAGQLPCLTGGHPHCEETVGLGVGVHGQAVH